MVKHNKTQEELNLIIEDIKKICLPYGYTPVLNDVWGELWFMGAYKKIPYTNKERFYNKFRNFSIKYQILNKYPFVCGLKL